MKSLLLLSILSIGLSGYSQKKPKYVPWMVEAEDVGYVKQTEVSVREWFVFAFDLMLDEYNIEELHQTRTYFPDLSKTNENYGFIYSLMSRIEPMEKIGVLADDDEEYLNSVLENNELDFDPDTLTETVKQFGFTFYLSPSELELYGAKIKMAMNMPVTGVSFELVNLFIEWETQIINNDKVIEKSDYEIELSLPNDQQWMALCSHNLPLISEHQETKQEFPDSVNTTGCPLYNYKPMPVPCHSDSGKFDMYGYFEGLVETHGYNPTWEGIYCLFGNVSEMTNEEGVAVGGSYNRYGYEAFPKERQSYDGPQPWLGFRYVGVLLEK